MTVKILKGTNQIGGCITEITTQAGTKIIIDFGEDLKEEKEKVEIEGLTKGNSLYDAVLITHSHGDHIGLVSDINPDIPIYMETSTKQIYQLCSDFITGLKPLGKNIKKIVFGKPFQIKDLKITPYLVDHSAYNSAMYLLEADGKRILHTGDYRNHGRKGNQFLKTVTEIGPIDLLITEGTTFGRAYDKFKTEEQLVREASPIFQNYQQVLLLQSSTNIDRLVTFYKASNHTKKYFVEDLFTASIASHLKKTIPSPVTHFNVSVWVSNKYRKKSEEFQNKYIVPMEPYQKNQPFHHDFCMMVKPSMLRDIQKLYEKGLLFNACLIYSMWDGYLKEESVQRVQEKMEELEIPVFKLHTSGHADQAAMRQLEKMLQPKKTICIHTEHGELAHEIFKTAIDLEDGKEIIV